MVEIELISEGISSLDNTVNVEMSDDEIWFLKYFIKEYNPKKIVEVGISAGGNTINILQWKDNDSQLFSIDIATEWYQDNSKLSGFMAENLSENKDNWKLFRGHDYLEVYEEIGEGIDFIIIDTVHFMPGEFFTFLAALPQLKEGCIVVLHDIHLNMLRLSGENFNEIDSQAYCTGLLFSGVSSNKKWVLKSDISNIGAFIVDKSTKENIKDIFHILCSAWYMFPHELNLINYLNYVHENYPIECYNLFNYCLKMQSKYFNVNIDKNALKARIDILNKNNSENTVKILNVSESVDVDFPDWFEGEMGKGVVIQSTKKSFDIQLKCINEGLLNLTLRGPDVRDRLGKRIPAYVDFTTFKINNIEILKDNVIVWHDQPFEFNKEIVNSEIVDIHIEWESPQNMNI